MWLRQSGLLTKWAQTYWPRTNRCSAPIVTRPSRINEKLTLNYLSGAFLLFGVGATISVVTFAFELLFGFRSMCKNQRQSTLPQDPVTSPIAINEYNTVSFTCPYTVNLDEDNSSDEPDENSKPTIL